MDIKLISSEDLIQELSCRCDTLIVAMHQNISNKHNNIIFQVTGKGKDVLKLMDFTMEKSLESMEG